MKLSNTLASSLIQANLSMLTASSHPNGTGHLSLNVKREFSKPVSMKHFGHWLCLEEDADHLQRVDKFYSETEEHDLN